MKFNYTVCMKNALGMLENHTVTVPTADINGWNKAIEKARQELGASSTEAPQSCLFAGPRHSEVD